MTEWNSFKQTNFFYCCIHIRFYLISQKEKSCGLSSLYKIQSNGKTILNRKTQSKPFHFTQSSRTNKTGIALSGRPFFVVYSHKTQSQCPQMTLFCFTGKKDRYYAYLIQK